MDAATRLGLILSVISVIGIPSLVFTVRAAMKWTRVETSLEDLVGDVGKLIADKDRVHTAIFDQMRADREATNQRLRWLEENVWQGQIGPAGPRRPR